METKIIGYWDIKKEKLKLRYPGITDDDVTYPEGKEKEMIELLGNKMPGESPGRKLIFISIVYPRIYQ